MYQGGVGLEMRLTSYSVLAINFHLYTVHRVKPEFMEEYLKEA